MINEVDLEDIEENGEPIYDEEDNGGDVLYDEDNESLVVRKNL